MSKNGKLVEFEKSNRIVSKIYEMSKTEKNGIFAHKNKINLT